MSSSSVTACLSEELDTFWAKAANVVETGDFATYASMYHQDAVLVQTHDENKIKGTSKPIKEALKDWKDGFEKTKSGQQTVKLSFRFGQRLHGSTAAHETGIFCYQCKANNSENTLQKMYLHFESLLIKKPHQGWLWMMEYQKHTATQQEWDALEPSWKQDG